jgi:hypothetical protein
MSGASPQAKAAGAKVVFSRAEEEEDEDEEDEGTLQRRAFPVGDDGGEPGDESVPPADGLAYLQRVRRQQKTLPAVVSARIDPERLARAEAKAEARHIPAGSAPRGSMLAALAAASSPSPLPPPAALLPSAAWQRTLLADFKALRDQLQRRLPGAAPPPTPVLMPDVADALGWEQWCCGGRSAGGSSAGRPPSLTLLSQLDQRRAHGLLRGVQLALERAAARSHADPAADAESGGDGECVVDGAGSAVGDDDARDRMAHGAAAHATAAPADALCQWAFAAFARIDTCALDAEACATIRAILRACAALRARLAAEEDTPADEHARRLAALNVLITLCGGFFRAGSPEEWEGA